MDGREKEEEGGMEINVLGYFTILIKVFLNRRCLHAVDFPCKAISFGLVFVHSRFRFPHRFTDSFFPPFITSSFNRFRKIKIPPIMLQRFVDNALAITKESVKTFTYESLNNVTRLINGVSALLLAILPGKTTILEGMHGWELRPSFRGPRLPRWMENGVSSFNGFIHELSVDSDTSSVDYTSGEDDDGDDGSMFPASPSSHTSRMSHSSSFARANKQMTFFRSIMLLISLTLWPLKFLLRIPLLIYHSAGFRKGYGTANGTYGNKRSTSLKDHVVQSTTDRRRGVIEDLHLAIEVLIEAVFDIFHKAAHFLLSPSKIYHIFAGSSSSYGNLCTNNRDGESVVPVPTSVLGDVDPTPTESQTSFRRSLNTDARTCKDVITELGREKWAVGVGNFDVARHVKEMDDSSEAT
ncbi:hypothetical protein KSP40_PGU020667 [Platanthera guangdongensis]|uniref:Uncharacterized protein n=1 Tax=Platanthera guangdongensis TaxID=2320717 RepID=A0ABR2LL49_9ASPA